jgi:hypothetical protein
MCATRLAGTSKPRHTPRHGRVYCTACTWPCLLYSLTTPLCFTLVQGSPLHFTHATHTHTHACGLASAATAHTHTHAPTTQHMQRHKMRWAAWRHEAAAALHRPVLAGGPLHASRVSHTYPPHLVHTSRLLLCVHSAHAQLRAAPPGSFTVRITSACLARMQALHLHTQDSSHLAAAETEHEAAAAAGGRWRCRRGRGCWRGCGSARRLLGHWPLLRLPALRRWRCCCWLRRWCRGHGAAAAAAAGAGAGADARRLHGNLGCCACIRAAHGCGLCIVCVARGGVVVLMSWRELVPRAAVRHLAPSGHATHHEHHQHTAQCETEQTLDAMTLMLWREMVPIRPSSL